MRLEVVLAIVLTVLAVGECAEKCSKCKTACACETEVARGVTHPPYRFYKKKKCNVTKPVDLKPEPDVCSCEREYRIRPGANEEVEPKFAKSRSCECGYDHQPQPPKKYPADIISRQLANEYAKKKDVPESELHFYGRAVTPTPDSKREDRVKEERLHKLNRNVLELKPAKRKPFYYHSVSSEEAEHLPCQPKQETYCDICYGKVDPPNPKFDVVKQVEAPCETCRDDTADEDESEEEVSTEKPCAKEKHDKFVSYERHEKTPYVSYEESEEFEESDCECSRKKHSRRHRDVEPLAKGGNDEALQ